MVSCYIPPQRGQHSIVVSGTVRTGLIYILKFHFKNTKLLLR